MRVHVCLARREGYLRDRKKKNKDPDDFPRLHFPSLFFFSLSYSRAYGKILSEARNVACRARPRPDSGVVLRESARV